MKHPPDKFYRSLKKRWIDKASLNPLTTHKLIEESSGHVKVQGFRVNSMIEIAALEEGYVTVNYT